MDRREDIDILKAFAIFGVILIHLISTAFVLYPKGSNVNTVFIFIDQAMRFSVPLFVALSGYTLALRYQTTKINVRDFYLRRATRIIPYYFLATAVIYAFIYLIPPYSQYKNPYSFLEIIFLGRADYHLYFVPMILQLYLIFPLVLHFLKKSKWLTLFASFAIQSLVFIFTILVVQKSLNAPFKWGDQQQYLISLSWIFYFTLGAFMALGVDRKVVAFAKKVSFLLAVVGLVFAFKDSHRLINAGAVPIDVTRFTKFSILLFSTGTIGASLLFKNILNSLPQILVKILAKIGIMSFSIYLLHTIAIRIVLLNLTPFPTGNFILFLAFSFIVAFILSWIFEEFLKIIKKIIRPITQIPSESTSIGRMLGGWIRSAKQKSS